MTEFKNGMKLKAVYGQYQETGGFFIAEAHGDRGNCTEITVVMQSGQMAGVPWAECKFKDGKVFLANLALMESVQVFETAESEK